MPKLTPEEISLIMQMVDLGFRAVAQEAGINVLADAEMLKSALDKLQAAYEKTTAGASGSEVA